MKVLNNNRGIKIKKELFHNVPNLSLRAWTFDVTHLSKFITQGTCELPSSFLANKSNTPLDFHSIKSQSPNRDNQSNAMVNRGFTQQQRNRSERFSNMKSELMTNIRPSSTFLSVPRYTNAYVITEKNNFEIYQKDLNKDPDPTESKINFFDSDIPERQKALLEMSKVSKDFVQMYNNKAPFKINGTESRTLLVSPKIKREEVKNLRENFKRYMNLKEKCMFTNKRNRQLKYGYRDKIRDVIIRPQTTTFFKSINNQLKIIILICKNFVLQIYLAHEK